MRKNNTQTPKLEDIKDKSTLVKLLAEEDVTVTYQKAQTASFNPITRQVILPIWKDKSESVMDMMSLHEVGHALYTEPTLIDKGIEKEVKHSFLNVLEDVRIEKMIQDKYLGSRKIFNTAYKELLSKDFFGIKDKDISKLNLIDRINMHYKHVPNVPFDNDELEWVEKANQTKTCDDVLNLAIELQEWMKQNQKDKTDEMFNLDIEMPQDGKDENQDSNGEQDSTNDKSKDDSENSSSGDNDTQSNGDTKDDSEKETSSKSSDDKESEEKENVNTVGYGKGTGDNKDSDFDGIEAVTDTNYQKRQYESVDKDTKSINYLNIPKINLKEIIVDYKQVNKELSEFYYNKSNSDDYNKGYMDFIKKDIVKFKKTQSQTISYMVKEFEMRKAADLYKRSTVAKTGQLNMNTLHSYSYNEDIFLKMNVEPGATNHGLVLFVDWSGSMVDNFHNTIKQTLNLVWFCDRVNIPFEVYAFTNGYGRKRDDTTKNIHAQKRKQDDMIINELTLLNLLSSRSSKSEMQEGLENLWAYSMYYGSQYSDVDLRDENGKSIYPVYPVSDYQLYSTPLNHTIIAAMDLVPQFKKDTGVQKVHSVFLTDGYSNSIDRKYEFTDEIHPLETKPDDWKGEIKGTYIPSDKDTTIIVSDPVTKKKYIQGEDERDRYGYYRSFRYDNQTKILLEFLKARLPGMTITNFFIAGINRKGTIDKGTVGNIFGLDTWHDIDKIKSIQKEIQKNNVAVCKTQGWDELYVLPGGEKLDVSDNDMSEITPGTAKKGELKKAFTKMSAGRKNSRPLLNKFIRMIA